MITKQFALKSQTMENNKMIPLLHVYKEDNECAGGNTAPVLTWENPPKEAKSFALTVFDPDAKMGKGFWHWIVINIPSKIDSILGECIPEGAVQISNCLGECKYVGPFPPVGSDRHRCIFTLYALGVERLDVSSETNQWSIKKAIEKHKIAEAFLTTFCERIAKAQ